MPDPSLAFESSPRWRRRSARALSPVSLTEALLDRVGLDGRLHAFIAVTRDRALAEARAAEIALRGGQDLGPLHGIPYAVKVFFDVRGVATTAGTSSSRATSPGRTPRSCGGWPAPAWFSSAAPTPCSPPRRRRHRP